MTAIQWKKNKADKKSYYSTDKRWYITNSDSEGWVLIDLNSGNRLVRKTLKDCKAKAEELHTIEEGIDTEGIIKINKKPSKHKNIPISEESKEDIKKPVIEQEIEEEIQEMSPVETVPIESKNVSISNLHSVVAKRLDVKPNMQSISSLTPVIKKKL